MEGLDLVSQNINLTGRLDKINLKNLQFKGDLTIIDFRLNQLMMDSLKLGVEAREGVINIREKRRVFLGGKVSGQAEINLNEKPVSVSLVHQVEGLSATDFLRVIDSDEYLEGKISYTLKIDFRSFDWIDARKSSNGSVAITGRDITYYGIDLDSKLEQYKLTENFDIWEVGAIFLSGPYGSAFASGLDYTSLLQNYQGEQTLVEELNAEWRIKNGIATTQDVAIRTGRYRISAIGQLDLSGNQFNDFSLSMLNGSGCAVFSQTLSGPFSNPQSESFAVRGVKMRSIEDIQRLFLMPANTNCTPVYKGKVSHQKEIKGWSQE